MLACMPVWGQITTIEGKVSDAKTGEPIPFAAISLKGTSVGTVTDSLGNYTLDFRKHASDSIVCITLGYMREAVGYRRGEKQVINFKLVPTSYSISEVVVRAGENPAHIILRKIIENKPSNTKRRYDTYSYQVYTKMQVDLNGFSEKLENKRYMRKLKFVFQNVDTTEDGRKFLPIFLTESVSDVYFSKNPPDQKEIIKGTKMSGLNNPDISQFLGDSEISFDIYDNGIVVASKSFVSPISNTALLFYKYHLRDSAFIGKHWCYKIDFEPKAKLDPTFSGFFWVHDTTFAIKHIEMTFNKDANLNFVNGGKIVQDFEQVDGKYWMRTFEHIDVEINPVKEIGKAGLFGHKTTTYTNIHVDEPLPPGVLKGGNTVLVKDDALDKGEAYWDSVRTDTLTKAQQGIYHMVDTIKKLPLYKRWEKIGYMAMTGFIPIGPIEIGPYYSLFTTNTIEGSRFRFGMRTGLKFSRRVEFSLYGAYGLKDEEWKYGGLVRWRVTPKSKNRSVFGADYKHDVELIGLLSRANLQLNIAASLGRRHPLNSLIFSDNANIYHEHDWFSGLTQKLTLTYRRFYPAGVFSFGRLNAMGDTTYMPSLTTSEISLMTYFAWGDKYIGGSFDRISTGTKYPAITFTATFGIKGIAGSQYNYQKLVLSIDDRFRIAHVLGYTDYYIEAGKIFGNLPYPLFNVHIGNETFALSNEYLNMANFFEFVSDQYVRLNVTHHFEGLLFNRIPLFRRLKWREVAVFKAITGTLSQQNKNEAIMPYGMFDLNKSIYMETGVGIENIFKVFRIDVLWRLTHLNHPDVPRIGIRGAVQIRL